MDKNELRTLFGSRRASLSKQEVANCTASICRLFSQIVFPPIHHLFSYVPLVSRNEFDVAACEGFLHSINPEMVLAKPRIDKVGHHMEACRIEPHTVFEQNSYGIPEPLHAEIMDPREFQMVFVPLLAFDRRGFRVGYGKGYYDRFLTRCNKEVLRVGFSCFDPVEEIEDISQFDVPLTHCITPSRIYEFQRPVA